MERVKCKLCLRSFPNGRALGGHMRSHNELNHPVQTHPGSETGSVTYSFSSSEGEDREPMCYGLRENPKRSIKLVDHEFSFNKPVPVHEPESETESSKNQFRRRSSRIRKPERKPSSEPESKRAKPGGINKPDSPEPVSSESDCTTEFDVAFCLMMMKSDKWMRKEEVFDDVAAENDDVAADEVEEDYSSDDDELAEIKHRKVIRSGKYKCDTCNKVFKTYQALGGHRASHKKTRINSTNPNPNPNPVLVTEKAEVSNDPDKNKIHECPVCFRVFASGQALGGHKRSHVVGSSSSTINAVPKKGLIDLNLPAPIDDDDEFSAVSDALN